jgi:hypothetical protein
MTSINCFDSHNFQFVVYMYSLQTMDRMDWEGWELAINEQDSLTK